MIYEDYLPTPPRRRRSVAELTEIIRQSEMITFMEQQQQMDSWIAAAQREAGIGGSLMDDPYFAMTQIEPESPEPYVPGPCEPGPSRVRSPSPELDGEPSPKKPCLKSSTYRRRFRAP